MTSKNTQLSSDVLGSWLIPLKSYLHLFSLLDLKCSLNLPTRSKHARRTLHTAFLNSLQKCLPDTSRNLTLIYTLTRSQAPFSPPSPSIRDNPTIMLHLHSQHSPQHPQTLLFSCCPSATLSLRALLRSHCPLQPLAKLSTPLLLQEPQPCTPGRSLCGAPQPCSPHSSPLHPSNS